MMLTKKSIERFKAFVSVAVIAILMAGCSPRICRLEIERPLPLSPSNTGHLVAGLSKVDITPPPGISKAGYSMMAHKGEGVRNRLHARAVYLRDSRGNAVALVQCDLLSGSRLLHHRVAELIAPVTDVSARGLMLSGTHTHSAPGNYFSSNFYNSFASGKSGFDHDLFEFLANKIAHAVVDACRNRRPAKIATGTTEIYGMTRNRSIEPYLANFEDSGRDVSRDPLKAVNPVLTMVRIDLMDDEGNYRPAGAFSSFSIHPTVVPYWNDFYTADVFGYISGELEADLRQREGTTPWPMVHAAVNCTHADNSPNYVKGGQGFSEARRIGVAIGKRAVSLFWSLGSGLSDDIAIRSVCREVDLYEHPAIDGISVCSRPVVGNALTAGAEDGKTPVLYWTPFFREGWGTSRWFFTGSCQGRKRHVGWIFQPLILKKRDFPHVAFFQLIQVGDRVFVPMPFEITFQAGRVISSHVADRLAIDTQKVVVVSCSNGYFGYATTPAEYGLQNYEGGHTLYGPETVPFLARQAAFLAGKMDQGLTDLPKHWSVDLKANSFFPEKLEPQGSRTALGNVSYHASSGKLDESYYRFRWLDVPPCMIDFDRPLVRIESAKDMDSWSPLYSTDGRAVDDGGYDLSVRFCGRINSDNMGEYEARWYNPETVPGRRYRFVVLPRGTFRTLRSGPFTQGGCRPE